MIIALLIYILALFALGVGAAVVTYHIIRFRDPDDISAAILAIFYALAIAILVVTAFLLDWQQIFG